MTADWRATLERVAEAVSRASRLAESEHAGMTQQALQQALKSLRGLLAEPQPLDAGERAELHTLRDFAQRFVSWGEDDWALMPWVDAHRHHAAAPYIGCPFCRDKFVLAEPQVNPSEAKECPDCYLGQQEEPDGVLYACMTCRGSGLLAEGEESRKP